MTYVNEPKVNQPLPFMENRRAVMVKQFWELAFEAVMEGGSYARARQILTKQGHLNKFNGKPYTTTGIYFAANRYLCIHQAELKDRLIEHWENDGVSVSDDEWEEFIVKRAVTVLGDSSKKKFMDWLANNPWAEKYDYMYAKRFGLEQKYFE